MSATGQGTQYALFESAEAIPVDVAQPAEAERRFSDYAVYVDESGDHSLASIDKDYAMATIQATGSGRSTSFLRTRRPT